MFSHFLLSVILLLQAAPQIHWKSEVKESPEGNQLVLTGELDPGIDHVTGTVTYMPCEGEACYLPVDWDFEEYFKPIQPAGEGRIGLGNIPQINLDSSPAEQGGASGDRSHPRLRKREGPAAEGSGRGPTQSDVSGGTALAAAESQNNNLWALILEAILWGFAMLLTPCVFPMVPMTVSFFMKGSDTPRRGRLRAALYGLFIVLLYTVPISLIIGITWIVGGSGVTADIFNWLSTHWLPNLIFFLVFMVFAASFFGAFEITLPSKWTNSADKNSDRKGLGGIFFLALTLVLVSFSCTGPIVGTVLIKSTEGEFWTPMVTMLAFSIAFALPFTLLAFFPSLLKKLPKSGGWLNSVKVVLGFIEIALGLKFLSTADQTYHWHLLDREVYLAIWIAVFTLLGLYLIGKIRFKHDSPLEYLSVGRLSLAIAVFAFVVYLLPGMWGAPLKGISGYLPPMETQDFVIGSGGGTVSAIPQAQQAQSGTIVVAHGLQAYDNLPDGLAAAKAEGKPVFLDFTGYGCVNCREMEARVWSDPEVLRRLREDFVIVALHVDDKTKLPESEWVMNDRGKPLKDVGRVNSYIALHDFGVNAQPNYFLLDGDGNRLAGPRPYNLDIQGFISFLDSAL
ncbi:MAG: thioredoxin fold domain-containing protein [Bacteroidales bacterium]|jgi:thiol:disulfide interchange protein|nr:thioredoxin fold domain-containing protein [Bacteroidales bacterium]